MKLLVPARRQKLIGYAMDGPIEKIVVFADMVGHSKKMAANEEKTINHINQLYVKIIEPSTIKNKGRIVKKLGDGFLLSFDRAVDAVRCAHDIVIRTNAEFCIGIDKGKCFLQEDGDLLGDVVNSAKRIQEAADAGEIWISETVRNGLPRNEGLIFEDVGTWPLKGTSPKTIFRINPGRALAYTPAIPLSANLQMANSPETVLKLLNHNQRTLVTVDAFAAAIGRLAEEDGRQFCKHLFHIIETYWKSNVPAVSLASVILTRVPYLTSDIMEMKEFFSKLENLIDKQSVEMCSAVESLSFIAMQLGMPASFVGNVNRMINDPRWRRATHTEQIMYYTTVTNAARALNSHVENRHSHLHAHDVGRLMWLLPKLSANPLLADMAANIKLKIQKGLDEIESGKPNLDATALQMERFGR